MISCTEVIDLDINSSHPQLVVEASMGLNQRAKVVLMRSIGLDENIELPFEVGAEVTLTDDAGITEMLTEVSPGIYFSQIMHGNVGTNYTLNIKTDSEVVIASSKMPEQVKIDSLTVRNTIYPGGNSPIGDQTAPFYEILVKYKDPQAQSNFYRFLVFVNGVVVSRNSISNDRLSNGNEIETFLVVYDPELKAGDTISVEMQCIEKSVYEYFSSIGSMGGPNSSSPANPYTNLNGAILGYFSAYTTESVNYILE